MYIQALLKVLLTTICLHIFVYVHCLCELGLAVSPQYSLSTCLGRESLQMSCSGFFTSEMTVFLWYEQCQALTYFTGCLQLLEVVLEFS